MDIFDLAAYRSPIHPGPYMAFLTTEPLPEGAIPVGSTATLKIWCLTETIHYTRTGTAIPPGSILPRGTLVTIDGRDLRVYERPRLHPVVLVALPASQLAPPPVAAYLTPPLDQPATSTRSVPKRPGRRPISPKEIQAFGDMLSNTTRQLHQDGVLRPLQSQIFVAWPGNHRYPKTHRLCLTLKQYNTRVGRVLDAWGYIDWDDYVDHVLLQ